MSTITVTKGSQGRFEAPGLGWIQPKGMLSNDYIGAVEGIGEITLTRNWSGREYTVTDAIGRVRGTYEKQGWAGSRGPLMWDDVDYEFAHHSGWNNSCVLRRHNEDLATFTPKWTGKSVAVELLDNAHVPPGLVLVGVWITLMRVQDSTTTTNTAIM